MFNTNNDDPVLNLKSLHELGFFLGYTAQLDDGAKVEIAKQTSIFSGIEVADTPEARRAFVHQVAARARALVEGANPLQIDMIDAGMQSGIASMEKVTADFIKELK